MVRFSIGFMAASQKSHLWRNVRRSTGKQKKFKRNFWDFWIRQKMRLTQFEGWRYVVC